MGIGLGIGIDVVEIERFARVLERRPGLAGRLFLPAELEYAASRARPAQHLAARFCAKEAVVKALRPAEWDWHDVEVLPQARVRLSGPLAAHGSVAVSLTHGDTVAAAVALAG
jgi:holo-[acyl-carrier protein] synthase